MELFDMKKHRFLFSASLMALVLLGCMAVVSCYNNFKHVPQTGFITHQVKNKDSHIPFDAYWNADDKKIWNDRVNGVDGKKVMMAVVPVDTEHMDVRPDTAEGLDALRGLPEDGSTADIVEGETLTVEQLLYAEGDMRALYDAETGYTVWRAEQRIRFDRSEGA